jgi:hypothetical protein
MTIGAVYTARSITFSAVPFGAEAATRPGLLPLSCVVSFKECQQDIRHLAKELGISRCHLLKRRHEIQKLAQERLIRSPLPDTETEADEMYQNAGEKGINMMIRKTHLAVAAINVKDWGLWRMIDRRFPV